MAVDVNAGDATATPVISDSDREHLYLLFFGEGGLALCGCGNPDQSYAFVRELLELAPLYEAGRARRATRLCGGPGPMHVVLSQLDRVGLMSHSSAINWAALTPKGVRALALMRAIPYSAVEEAGFPHEGGDCGSGCWGEEGA